MNYFRDRCHCNSQTNSAFGGNNRLSSRTQKLLWWKHSITFPVGAKTFWSADATPVRVKGYRRIHHLNKFRIFCCRGSPLTARISWCDACLCQRLPTHSPSQSHAFCCVSGQPTDRSDWMTSSKMNGNGEFFPLFIEPQLERLVGSDVRDTILLFIMDSSYHLHQVIPAWVAYCFYRSQYSYVYGKICIFAMHLLKLCMCFHVVKLFYQRTSFTFLSNQTYLF